VCGIVRRAMKGEGRNKHDGYVTRLWLQSFSDLLLMNADQYRHISLYCTSQIFPFFFLQIEVLWQPCVKQDYRCHFSNSMCSLRVSVSPFGNSRNISYFFIIIISVMVICDQWYLILLLLIVLGRCYQTTSHPTEKSFVNGRVNRFGKLHCCLILRNCHSHPNLQHPPPWSVSNHQHRGNTLHQQKDYDSLKAQMMVSIFSNKVLLIEVCTLFI
jgi:hypothetical protein